MALLETDHLGVLGRQQGGDALLSDRVNVVVHRHTCGGGGTRGWHVNEGGTMDDGHGSWLWLLLRRERELDVLWVV